MKTSKLMATLMTGIVLAGTRMKNKVATMVFILVISVPLLVQAFAEQTRIVTPANAQKFTYNSFRIKIEKEPPPSTDYSCEVSGRETDIADLENDVIVCTSQERVKWKSESFLFAPAPFSIKQINVKRNIDSKKAPGMKVWSVKFKVPKSKSSRTYLLVPPPQNTCDGTTFIFDLPAFIDAGKETTAKNEEPVVKENMTVKPANAVISNRQSTEPSICLIDEPVPGHFF